MKMERSDQQAINSEGDLYRVLPGNVVPLVDRHSKDGPIDGEPRFAIVG